MDIDLKYLRYHGAQATPSGPRGEGHPDHRDDGSGDDAQQTNDAGRRFRRQRRPT